MCDLSILNEPRFDAIRSTSSTLFAGLFKLRPVSASGLLSWLLLSLNFYDNEVSLVEERIKSLQTKTDKESRSVHNEFMELVRFQANLEEKSRISFDELSVTQTLYRCIQESVVPSSTLEGLHQGYGEEA